MTVRRIVTVLRGTPVPGYISAYYRRIGNWHFEGASPVTVDLPVPTEVWGTASYGDMSASFFFYVYDPYDASDLTVDVSGAPPPPTLGTLECHAYLRGTECSSLVTGAGTVQRTTPFTAQLPPGRYTLTAYHPERPNEVTQTKDADIVAGQVTRVDFTFNGGVDVGALAMVGGMAVLAVLGAALVYQQWPS
jgi:hypothetical protein